MKGFKVFLSFCLIFPLGQGYASLRGLSSSQPPLHLHYSNSLEALERFSFDSVDHVTNALLIIKNGTIIFERYANGFEREKPHRLWSISKSITNIIMGIAEKKNILHRTEYAGQYFAPLARPETNEITISHLLRMSSGLKWSESYEENPLKSDVVKMLYTIAFKDMASYVGRRPVIAPPGERFYYSSGETNLLTAVLKGALPPKDYEEFPFRSLFAPLGIKSATWERDERGVFIGSSYLFMTARDLARLGQFFLQKGNWKGQQYLPDDWYEYSIKVAPAFLKTELKGSANRESFGASWWLNRDLPEKKESRMFPFMPEDMIYGSGHHGQRLFLFPTQKMIIVRFGADKEKSMNDEMFLNLVKELF